MKKIILILTLLAIVFPPLAAGARYARQAAGYILLQVEDNGEAWYVYPPGGTRHYLGRPADAFEIMKTLALGVKHEIIANTDIFPSRFSGLILLDVEANGQAYYIYPRDLKKYYLGRPADAFRIMRELGLGITNAELDKLPEAGKEDEKIFIDNVPFTAQAPFADWADQRQQDGCEEAASLMAVKWARGQSLTKEQALSQITGISDWLLKKYGEYRDISAQNSVDWIFKDYFNFNNVALVKDITVNDIIKELAKGNLVITPMNGQMMHNPNYKLPGPPRHMIVIRGYDPAVKQFITNDPGTRKGELYRYDATRLYAAIRDYPTGYHEVIKQIEKNMIVVEKQ